MKGFQLGTYILEEKLGEGGMAEVWRARNPLLNTFAAVKFLSPQYAGNPDIETRFLGEGKRQATLQHPNIVSAFDFHYVDNRSYLMMRYIKGENLEQRLFKLQAPMSLSGALAISRDVLGGLQYAHSHGVIHRDIKPSNLLIENGGQTHILDFGIALVVGEEHLTRGGAAAGTPRYMSPEQITGAQAIDGRSDIYSFGCVLYQMLTQATPFDSTEKSGNFEYIVKEKHLREEPVPPSRLNRTIPDYVERAILRCLAKKPEGRYNSCADVISALSGAYNAPFVSRDRTIVESLPQRPLSLHLGATAPAPAESAVRTPTVFMPVPVPMTVPVVVAPADATPVPRAKPSRRALPWIAAGTAFAVLLCVAGYFGLHHDEKKPVVSATVQPQPPPRDPVHAPDLRPDNRARVHTGPVASVNPSHLDVTNAPATPTPPINEPQPKIVDTDQLLRDGKSQLARHDDVAARETFKKAVDAGNAQAMVLLGSMYTQGLGGPKSDTDAVSMFQQAAELGYVRGMFNLAVMYETGRGVPASPDNQAKAAQWYAKAAERSGGGDAAYRLGLMYEEGRGVPKDLNQARKLYAQARTPEAANRLSRLPAQ